MATTARRLRVCIALTLTLLLGLAPAASATTTDDPARAAAGWLARQLVDGERLEGSWVDEDGEEHVFVDHGGTVDVVLALSAASVAAGHIEQAMAWLTSEAGTYTGEDFGTTSAGATAKLALAAMTAGLDATDVGGHDLVSILLELEDPDTGRLADRGDDDWSSTFTHALGVLALVRAEHAQVSRQMADFLLAQQCDDGGFRFQPDDEPCTSDADTTAMALHALLALGEDTSATVAWLIGQQSQDGGFGNANTTGLAAAALSLAGEQDAAGAAQSYLVGLQDGCGADATGQIAFDETGEGDPVFATRQAILGLTAASFVEVSAAGADTSVPELDCPTRGWTLPVIVALAVFAVVAIVLVRSRRS